VRPVAAYIDRQAGDPSRASFAAARQDDDALVGDVVLNEMDARNRTANVRIFVASQHTGRGYGTEGT